MFFEQTTVSSAIAPIVSAVQPWQTLYSEHTSVSTAVLFVHLAALVASAGLAVSNDRAIVRTTATDTQGHLQRLSDLQVSHKSVLVALSVSFASGLLLLLADLEAFAVMPAFWTKMGLILLLITNASFMMRKEKQVRTVIAANATQPSPLIGKLWKQLRRHAVASLSLWFAIVLAGTAMTST